jgi:ketosteroid isomerase-like protein
LHANAELIDRFYRAAASHDPDGMVACYHPQVLFSDPAFGELRGDHARAMWRMLMKRSQDLIIKHSDVTADDQAGSARWEARYTFTKTGRPVHNRITAAFRFKEGLILEHHDQFDLWAWAAMALGPKGRALGWLAFVQKGIRREANRALDEFLARGAK